MRRRGIQGFTLIELIIATTAFSVVILVALSGFLQIGRLFYKGVSNTQTQTVAKQILSDVTDNIQKAATLSGPIPATYDPGVYDYYCIGGARYTFKTNNQVDFSATQDLTATGNYGLIKDNLIGGSSCAQPCQAGGGCSQPFSQQSEMLGDKMRLTRFDITPVTGKPNLFSVDLVLAYGNTNDLDLTDPNNPQCVGNSADQQFCSVAKLNTAVYKGVTTP